MQFALPRRGAGAYTGVGREREADAEVGNLEFPLRYDRIDSILGVQGYSGLQDPVKDPVKDPALLRLQHKLRLLLRSDPWPGISICHEAAKTESKERKKVCVTLQWTPQLGEAQSQHFSSLVKISSESAPHLGLQEIEKGVDAWKTLTSWC